MKGTFINQDDMKQVEYLLTEVKNQLGILNKQENIEGKDRVIINEIVSNLRTTSKLLEISLNNIYTKI